MPNKEKDTHVIAPNTNPIHHGFDWNSINTDEQDNAQRNIENLFSRVCDVLQFSNNAKIGESDIEKDGYYREGFYMLRPFYYLDGGLGLGCRALNGLIFTVLKADADLNRLPIDDILPDVDNEAIEHLPVVVFRKHQGSICIPGTQTDLSEYYHCQNDTHEFIGVFRAQKISDEYCILTKVFDRYYFDSSKIK